MPSKSVMLAPNKMVPFQHGCIPYPSFISRKYDGNRILIKPGQWLTRSLKKQPNKRLREFFPEIFDAAYSQAMVFDGEMYHPDLSFSQLQSRVRSHNGDLSGVKLYLFDCIPFPQWECGFSQIYHSRYTDLQTFAGLPNVVIVEQITVDDFVEAKQYYHKFLTEGYEGAILRSRIGKYKHGRATVNECNIFKFKEMATEDGQIIFVHQRRKMKEGLERTRDVLGHLERSHKQEDYEWDDQVGSIEVRLRDGRKVCIGFSEGWCQAKRKRMIWDRRDSIVGRWVEFKYMEHGTKDVPRMGRLIRFRPDLDI